MSKYIKVSLFSLFFLFGSFSLCFAEDITITTYYPAPYGVYQELRLFPHSAPITVCNDDHKGVMYYDFDDDELKVCRGDAAGWLANDYWVLDGNNLSSENTNWKVGIGTAVPEFRLSLDNDAGIIAKGTYFSGATLTTAGPGARLIWYPRKGAFRAGVVTGNQWNDANIGAYSFAVGQNTTASNTWSSAMGMGTATGTVSVAMGSGTASGGFATAMGVVTTAQSYASLVIGRYNVISGSAGGWVATDPLFVIGNGSGAASRSNAMTVLKNGNVGIGTVTPGEKVDIYDGNVLINDGIADDINSSSSSYKLTFDAQLANPGAGRDLKAQIYLYPTTWDNPFGESRLAFQMDGDTKMVLAQNGNFGIGIDNPNNKLSVSGNADFSGNVSIGTGSAGAYRLYVNGDAYVSGVLTAGTKSFLIDHPLDPQNKVLRHSTVESPDIKNIYDGTVILDENGEAIIELPSYFEALNKDFHYQLTCIGKPGLIYVKEEVSDNRFVIAGGVKGLKVSWQVTGIRKDVQALKNPVIVEEEKGVTNSFTKGEYLCPECFM